MPQLVLLRLQLLPDNWIKLASIKGRANKEHSARDWCSVEQLSLEIYCVSHDIGLYIVTINLN